MCMSEGCCAAAMGRWERSRVRAHVEFTGVGYIQLLLRMCATIRYHFRVVPLRDDKGVLRQRWKMRLIFCYAYGGGTSRGMTGGGGAHCRRCLSVRGVRVRTSNL